MLSIGLGSNEVSLLTLTRAYAVFADGGPLRDLSAIRPVVDFRGTRLLQQPGRAEDAVSPGIPALMTGLLRGVPAAAQPKESGSQR